MISGYIKNERIGEARKMFDDMPSRNTVSWSLMVSGYIRQKHLDEALDLFKQSPSLPTSIYNALLSGYVELGCIKEAEDLFARMDSRDAASWNSMITCYSRAGKMELAQQLFDEMPQKDVISWTAIIRGHLQKGNVERASVLFEMMPDRDIMSWNTMMDGLVQNGLLDDALNLFHKMPSRDIVSWNTILQGYVLKNEMVNAKRWFENMPQRSETSWNTLISGYQTAEALVLFCDMVKEGFKPDQVTLVIAISICGSLVALGCGKMLHLYVIKTGYEHKILVASSLISMYSRCGFVEDSSLVFKSMSKRDTIAWNAMISAYAYHGFPVEALELYKKMIRSKFHPDHVTFLNLLLACSHKGLINEGFWHFKSMQDEWKLAPRAEHYSCLVDLLGRSGFIAQAYNLTEKVPEDLQSNAWETLLSACQVHGHLEVGELTAERVFVGKHSDGGMHVILSNIYAAKGKWSEASQIRALMKEHGLKKETGCSWIEVQGKMFYFVSNDKSHPHVEQICRELDCIFLKLEGTA
ncbi:pentatricopeptide repeat-containing protein At4g02750-like isoform X1 [Phalaenopsis equestris]|uniref:pentatricopeptide repeat-containing protein At4g02750-like isoform X1 n=1 Tax=Phalaenopsis equestris TaxID=78828 RepID=UPI0009E48B36|nr:pentatricopeptide repeat-containing protein At4g02750-like isoform X1 [Phalaenopsis equestris]